MARLELHARCVVPPERIWENMAHAKASGLPFVEEKERPPLAVLGGGRSAIENLEWVRDFPGDKWLIGSSFKWWTAQGIDGTFYSVHPSPNGLANIEGVERAIVATVTDPSVLEALEGAEIQLFDMEAHGATSATAVPYLALKMGYSDVTFIGCESDYNAGSHAYMEASDPFLMKVRCHDQEFLTGAEFTLQAEFLSTVIRGAPHVFRERSGGLLRAMIADPDWEPLAISTQLLAEAF
jgi:hypothetical protein